MEKKRNFKFDNIKAILILLVIFGHLLEPLVNVNVIAKLLYIIIYTFHMPAFIYIMGRFAKPKLKRLTFFLFLYFPFQIIYTLFLQHFGFEKDPFTFLTPQWILWYLIAAIAYNLISFFIPSSPTDMQKRIGVGLSCVIAVIVGFIPQIGTQFSLSRILVFLPFFFLGKWKMGEQEQDIKRGKDGKENGMNDVGEKKKKEGRGIWIGVMATMFSLIYAFSSSGNYPALWQSCGYVESQSAWYFRIFALMIGFLWIYYLLKIVHNKEIAILTSVGQHTLFIFLTHGFVVKLLIRYCKTSFNVVICFVLTVLIAIILWLVSKTISHFCSCKKN